jgi:hypothetical protein
MILRNRVTGDVQPFTNCGEQVFAPSVRAGVADRRARIVVVTGGIFTATQPEAGDRRV